MSIFGSFLQRVFGIQQRPITVEVAIQVLDPWLDANEAKIVAGATALIPDIASVPAAIKTALIASAVHAVLEEIDKLGGIDEATEAGG